MSDITMEILEEYGEEQAKSAFEKSKKRGVEKFSDFIEKTYKEELEAMGADSDTVQIALNFIVEGKFAETGKKGIESKMDLIFGDLDIVQSMFVTFICEQFSTIVITPSF